MFKETFKAIEITKNIQHVAERELTYPKQIEILKEERKRSTSVEQYEAYTNKIKELENKNRFDSVYYVPTNEEREKLENNYKIELEQANKKYNQLKDKAVKELENTLKKITPMLEEMEGIAINRYNAGYYIDELLGEHVQAKPVEYVPLKSKVHLFPET